jgi:uncharacterized membrane protein (DUF4010 family)
MDLDELLSRFALSLGIGLLIGLERGWHTREAPPGSRTAGVRTFAITGLLGGTIAALARGQGSELSPGGSILLAIAFLAYAGVITVFSRDENKATNTFSATTAIAGLLTFMFGVYALFGDVRVAAAAAVATAGILVVREELHEWVAKLSLAEFESGLVLLAMTFIALPILPNRAFPALGGVNPRQVWIVAIVLATVSFGGYVAAKMFGERRGVLVAAAAGGLVSSTAVSLANARRAASGEGSPSLLAGATALATAVSFLRVLAIVVVLKPGLVLRVAPALFAATIVATGFAAALAFRHSDAAAGQSAVRQLRNPFGFWSVVAMALSIGILIGLGRSIYERFGGAGAISSAAIMGLFDVDAMTVSMTRLTPSSGDFYTVAADAILVGVASNTLTKVAIGAVVGRGRFGLLIAMVGTGCVIAGWLTLELTAAMGL